MPLSRKTWNGWGSATWVKRGGTLKLGSRIGYNLARETLNKPV